MKKISLRSSNIQMKLSYGKIIFSCKMMREELLWIILYDKTKSTIDTRTEPKLKLVCLCLCLCFFPTNQENLQNNRRFRPIHGERSSQNSAMYIIRFNSNQNHHQTAYCFSIMNHHQLLFFPNPPSNSQLELFFITTRKVQSHVPRDDESILTISDFPVTVSDASRNPLPRQFTAVSSNFQTVTKLLSLLLVSHEP